MAMVSIISFDLAVPVIAGVFAGRWLDGKLSSEPLFLVVGILLGLVAGVFAVVKSLQFLSGESNE